MSCPTPWIWEKSKVVLLFNCKMLPIKTLETLFYRLLAMVFYGIQSLNKLSWLLFLAERHQSPLGYLSVVEKSVFWKSLWDLNFRSYSSTHLPKSIMQREGYNTQGTHTLYLIGIRSLWKRFTHWWSTRLMGSDVSPVCGSWKSAAQPGILTRPSGSSELCLQVHAFDCRHLSSSTDWEPHEDRGWWIRQFLSPSPYPAGWIS